MTWLPGFSKPQRHLHETQSIVQAVICWITMSKEVMLLGMFEPDDGDNTLLRNVKALSDYTL